MKLLDCVLQKHVKYKPLLVVYYRSMPPETEVFVIVWWLD